MGFIKKIFCLHLQWHEQWGKNYYQTFYVCCRCGKLKAFDNSKPPINFIK